MNKEALHIEFEKLTDLIAGNISGQEKDEIDAHLRICQECAALKTKTQNFVGVMRSDALEEVPLHILERSFDLLRERKTNVKTEEKPSLFRKIVAVFSDEGLTPAFGLRSSQTENSRRFWLIAEDSEIDLRVEKRGETSKISGQIFGEFSGGKVALRSDENTFDTDLTDLSEFSFAEIPNGNYSLLIYFEQPEIEIPSINVE